METQAERYKTTLAKYLPAASIETVFQFLTQENQVSLHITRERHSKLGDYSWPQTRRNYHKISINGNLNPYFFLWVLLHEMAHLETWKRHGNRVMPHGHEWQVEYAKLILSYLQYFPKEAQTMMQRYAKAIPLNHVLHTQIENSLLRYDSGFDAINELRLNDLQQGDVFELRNKPDIQFKAIEKRRTRWRCVMLSDGREYLVAGNALVKKI